ncbi:hypothetical protein MNBD_NITROSPINAE03-974 [hydrothermal vent metagenome]|uniref:Uncharacterized protein n=1 Tax=hydrothermal vent metagenome TaxID=652676 RepID=A0A3B1CAZ6_9ZZZZ
METLAYGIIIDFIPAIATGAAALAAYYSYCGLETWRKELKGKKKFDVAEETLVLVYQARRAISYMRSPLGFSGEGSTRDQNQNEANDEKEIWDSAYVPHERFNKNKETFSKLDVMKYRFEVLFGKELTPPFDAINEAVNRVLMDVNRLGRLMIEEKNTVR